MYVRGLILYSLSAILIKQSSKRHCKVISSKQKNWLISNLLLHQRSVRKYNKMKETNTLIVMWPYTYDVDALFIQNYETVNNVEWSLFLSFHRYHILTSRETSRIANCWWNYKFFDKRINYYLIMIYLRISISLIAI